MISKLLQRHARWSVISILPIRPFAVSTKLRLALWLCASCLVFSQQATATQFGDIDLTAESLTGESRHGYLEYRFNLVNRSPKRHQVTLEIPKFSSPSNAIQRNARSVVVEPLATMTISIYQPPLQMYPASGVKVVIDNQEQDEPLTINTVSHGMDYYYGSPSVTVCFSQSLGKENFKEQLSSFSSTYLSTPGSPGYSGTSFTFHQPDNPVSQWSTNWLSYSRYDGVGITGDDWQKMPAGVQAALWNYVQCGGTLMVFGAWENPQLRLIQPERKGVLNVYPVGFGLCLCPFSPLMRPTELTRTEWDTFWDSLGKTQAPFKNMKSTSDANRAFPVVDNLKIPSRGLFLMMLMFVIVIGPVNLWVLARKKKKIWLLWTVPAFSLFTCLAVAGYATFSEGFKAYSRTEGLTILDETTHQATTIGWTAFYSPLTPSDGLRFGYETELTPQAWRGYSREGAGGKTLDWSQDQHLASGWVNARVPAHFMIRKTETRRERLTINQEADGSISIVNGLGGNLQQLWYANQNGEIFTVSKVPAGAQARLNRTELKAFGNQEKLREIYTWDWVGNVYNCTHAPDALLKPGCYIAWLDGCPFIEEGLRSVSIKKQQAVVYGMTRGPANAN